jgi:hypothetical protein
VNGELETGVVNEVLQIIPVSRLEIVDAKDGSALADKPIAQMRAEKSRSSGHQHG